MRRLGLVLVAVGIFLVVAAPLIRWYAYPRLAVAPAGQNSVTVLTAKNATIFNKSTLQEMTTNLTTSVATVGDVKASQQAGNNTVVWVSKSSTKSSDGTVQTASIERQAFNATTAMAVQCCGTYDSTTQGQNTPTRFQGLLVKFPFNTQKATYPFWDDTLGRTVPITYVGTATVDGTGTYVFRQVIPATKTGTQKVPASLLGLSGNAEVTADSMYANTRTIWVEPNTGVIINRVEAQNSTLDYQGTPRLTTTKATLGYNQATVSANAKKYGSSGQQLSLLRGVAPWVALIVGLVLLVIGLLLTLRGSTPREPEESE